MWSWKVAMIWIALAVFEVSATAEYSGSSISRRRRSGNSSSAAASSRVLLGVFYETNCPDSMRFITEQVYPVYRDMRDMVDITLVPFGKAHETYDSVSRKYVFRCQHGPAECYGNTVQSCAIALYPEVQDHINFVYCMETYPRPSDAGEKCARRLGLEWSKISKCANGDQGNKLLHEMGTRTNSLSPQLTFVPWITVNNAHSSSQQSRCLRDLKGVVCDSYAGNPSQC